MLSPPGQTFHAVVPKLASALPSGYRGAPRLTIEGLARLSSECPTAARQVPPPRTSPSLPPRSSPAWTRAKPAHRVPGPRFARSHDVTPPDAQRMVVVPPRIGAFVPEIPIARPLGYMRRTQSGKGEEAQNEHDEMASLRRGRRRYPP